MMINKKKNLLNLGLEIEQVDESQNRKHVFSNPNPSSIPEEMPPSVVENTEGREFSGSYDASGPWEFKIKYGSDLPVLKKTFDRATMKHRWCWSNQNNGGGNGSHYNISVVRTDYPSGEAWIGDMAKLYNTVVELQPLLFPCLIFGRQGRPSIWHWAAPVYDRIDGTIASYLYNGVPMKGTYTMSDIRPSVKDCSPNFHGDRIEIRVGESHPYWTVPFFRAFQIYLDFIVSRGSSPKLADRCNKLRELYQKIDGNDVYRALYLVKDIRFLRTVPRLRERYESGLDFFRAFCWRFVTPKNLSEKEICFGKVMRLFADFVDLSSVPAHLIWDVDQLYYMIYENPDKDAREESRKNWLYYGGKVIQPVGARLDGTNTVKKLLEA